MEAELRSLFSTDVDDLASYAPGETFCLSLRALIGPKGAPGEESFDFEVCSPAWLAAEVKRENLVSGRFCLFMVNFDYGAVERYVAKRIAQATGNDWTEVATKLARWSRWEFEDYVEPPSARQILSKLFKR
ncbi:immunity 8 family protein [Sphingomonas sp. QA11]|uniref:immunity 8 family protein n=1 Tax=Sphingomonas sp. QA11 TaxID=2950605 RepID=UPI00234AFDD4|nr:immunity 8 family protein [Sphingomonas sp. QA11]WCM25134.1 immunity 8 family protein [Sphingomonas sp. QA11]